VGGGGAGESRSGKKEFEGSLRGVSERFRKKLRDSEGLKRFGRDSEDVAKDVAKDVLRGFEGVKEGVKGLKNFLFIIFFIFKKHSS
jgi:hypothetical protein